MTNTHIYIAESSHGGYQHFQAFRDRRLAAAWLMSELDDHGVIQSPLSRVDYSLDIYDSVAEAIHAQLSLDEDALPETMRLLAHALAEIGI